MSETPGTIGIVGAGAWGSALAATVRRAGRDAILWARDPAVADEINRAHTNAAYLPDIVLDRGVRATNALAEVAAADALLLVTPAQHLRAVTRELAPHLAADRPIVLCAKGIEQRSGTLMSEVLAETLPGRPLAVLSGPTFADEVARGLPTAVTLAAADVTLGEHLIAAIGSRTFRPYLSHDPIGTQIGGAVKNVIAIACGIVAGRALGENARAALITRGLAEIGRLSSALGARPETRMGLSGLGDLALTCTSMRSRNYSLGRALGEGRSRDEVLGARRSVTEGVSSAAAVLARAQRHGVDMPITAAVDAILNQGAGIEATIAGLLARPFTVESD